MKRKMKAVAALSLAAVMLLAGCGSSKGTQDGGSTTAADTAEQISPITQNWFLPVSRSQQQQHLLCMIRRSLMIMDLTILMKHGLGKMCLMRQRK